MGNCGSKLKCTVPSDGILSADADIVGIGVLIAFFLTAVATIGAIIWGYLSDSLHESRLNDLDKSVIQAYQNSWVSRRAVAAVQDGWYCLTKPIMAMFEVSPAPGPTTEIPRSVRQEALTRFILVLSDQQLVTGLAILISGVANECKLTGYEFSVMLSLACFSSTTHLATLDALQEYFIAHPSIRNWRVGGMVLLLLLLATALFTTTQSYVTNPDPKFLSVGCTLADFNGNLPKRDSFNTISGYVFLAPFFALILVFGSYAFRISTLYGNVEHQCWLFAKYKVRPIMIDRQVVYGPAEEREIRAMVPEAMAIVRASWTLNYVELLRKASYWKRFILLSEFGYGDSFLSSLSGVAFSLAYGTSQLGIYRWYESPPLSAGSNSMDFGQKVPLFLLALPVLAAAEIYCEHQGSNAHSSSSSPTRSLSPNEVLNSGDESKGFGEETTQRAWMAAFRALTL